ncbi:hypothetical protein HAU46_08460 [Weissella confusa]|uniref:hypothetical protein n=1 Tax=Weissella confusa TaxID=1583 RepID=UPI0018F1FF6C|nr:hypothetical protein [Weissella confusa]MBJ7648002.1 hypothetical protein [Weissella confusa]
MTNEKKLAIADALSGLSYREWSEISQLVEANYHTLKSELTSSEVSSLLANRF